ncbi:Photosystem II reaction center protein ycf12 [Parathermosynechococcus lividus PCC 6715]|uniref:Photosystem II reaction center protein Psb30 n=1 Tax=Parathermosynechococcus lividus PCC 6715 TaxID=1917166 RepID=A0A2D2Q549_PARLV|nr:Photosystem II reaction center protein ycf12 [Thermostichus lividus PCC 6715]
MIDFVANINFEVIAQLTMISMIGLAGPMVVFLLAVRRGNL